MKTLLPLLFLFAITFSKAQAGGVPENFSNTFLIVIVEKNSPQWGFLERAFKENWDLTRYVLTDPSEVEKYQRMEGITFLNVYTLVGTGQIHFLQVL